MFLTTHFSTDATLAVSFVVPLARGVVAWQDLTAWLVETLLARVIADVFRHGD